MLRLVWSRAGYTLKSPLAFASSSFFFFSPFVKFQKWKQETFPCYDVSTGFLNKFLIISFIMLLWGWTWSRLKVTRFFISRNYVCRRLPRRDVDVMTEKMATPFHPRELVRYHSKKFKSKFKFQKQNGWFLSEEAGFIIYYNRNCSWLDVGSWAERYDEKASSRCGKTFLWCGVTHHTIFRFATQWQEKSTAFGE